MEEVLGDNSTLLTTERYNCTYFIHPYNDITQYIIKYTSISLTPFGIPANILAFLVWIRPGMRRSSGVYLAWLAITQNMILACRVIVDLQLGWQLPVMDYPVFCELFVVFYYSCQYLDPLLYFAFTVERYISVYHPFRHSQLCTIKRAIYVSVALVCLSLATSSMHAYLYTFDDTLGCSLRYGAAEGFWDIWTLVTESVFFLLVPVTVLVLNILVIRAINKSRNRFNVSATDDNNVAAHSKLLLYTSFYFIISVLPTSIIYLLWKSYPVGEPCVVQEDDFTWIAHHRYLLARAIVAAVTHLRYFMNFYIYMFIGKEFRKEFCKMISCCNRLHRSPETSQVQLSDPK